MPQPIDGSLALPEDARVQALPTPAFACAEVRGGIRFTYERVELPGLRGAIYSRPCDGLHGGDIHYLSVCGSGLLSRMCLADVAGHGDVVAAVSNETCDQLRRSVDTVDDRRVLSALDRRLAKRGVRAMTTAVLASYFPPTGRLSVSYAGHPEGWLYSAADRQWRQVEAEPAPPSAGPLVGLPLNTGLSPAFTRRRLKVAVGDRLLLLTDGVLEAESPDGVEFGREGVHAVLSAHDGPPESLVDALMARLSEHAGTSALTHDDVTIFAAEFVDAPPGNPLWHVLKNRLGFWRSRVTAK